MWGIKIRVASNEYRWVGSYNPVLFETELEARRYAEDRQWLIYKIEHYEEI
jgi:hypothetical protein